MESMTGTVILVGVAIGVVVLVGVVALLVVVPGRVLRGMEPALRRRIDGLYSPEQILLSDLQAVTLGLESRGFFQGRGNGALVLTADGLCWLRFMPEDEIRIRCESITKVDTVRSHLGKSYGRELLRVSFTHDGQPNSMAWWVTDLGAWLAKLGEAASNAR